MVLKEKNNQLLTEEIITLYIDINYFELSRDMR
jgi:hypothetical protein